MSYNKILDTQCYEIKEGWSWGVSQNELFLAKKWKLTVKNQHKM